MKNLVLSLLERERSGQSQQQHFYEALEYKTATLSSIHINYDLQDATRSTFVIAFSPDKTKIATSHGNHTIKISDCYTFKVLLTLKGHPRTPWCVTFHPHINSLLASGCLGGQVRVWDLNKITDDNIVYQSQAVISSLSFHPVNDILVMSTHNKIIFYDWNTQQIVKTIQMKHHSESIRLVRFLPNGSKLITGITNASSQYCRPERLNVSTRGDPRGHSVVQTVSCMRMQQRCHEERPSCPGGSQPRESLPENKDSSITNKQKNETFSDQKQNCDEQKGGRSKHKLSRKSSMSDADLKNDGDADKNDSSIKDKKRFKTDGGESKDFSSNYKPFHCRKKTDSNFSKRDRIPLSRKSCINFFRQPSFNFTPSHSSCGEEDPISSSSKSQSESQCSNTTESQIESSDEKAGPSRNIEEHRSQFTSSSITSQTSSSVHSSPVPSNSLTSVFSSSTSGSSSVRIFIEDGNTNERISSVEDNSDLSMNHSENLSSSNEEQTVGSSITSRSIGTNTGQQVRSEIWNFNLGPTTSTETSSNTSESLNDLDISVEGAASTIPVQGYLSFPLSNMDQSTDVTSLLGVRTAVATATARSSHHVHTAVVIASQENDNSETTLQTAVNRAIAGAFAGSGEGAVASNIIDTTHRLQLWDSSDNEFPDIQDEKKNVIVPVCKIHNDSSFDISLDGSYVAVFVPSAFGFPNDAQIKVISLKPETFLQCIYSRKYGPNAVSVSLSSLSNYLMIGLASRKLDWQLSSSHLIGQVLKLPSPSLVNFEDKSKPVLNIEHKCNQNQRSNISVNTIRFHQTPGMGILYGTNRGHVQHCHIAPDYELNERRKLKSDCSLFKSSLSRKR